MNNGQGIHIKQDANNAYQILVKENQQAGIVNSNILKNIIIN